MKNLEIKTIEHKGIKVIVKIDYDKGEASLVEFNGDHYGQKNWVFARRGLGYMNDWVTILEAMTVAVKECKKELEFSLAQSSSFKDKQIEETEEKILAWVGGKKKIALKKTGR